MKNRWCWWLLVVALTGCDRTPNAVADESSPPPVVGSIVTPAPTGPQLSRYGDLKPEAGHPDKLIPPTVSIDPAIDLPSKTGYGKPTKQRFSTIFSAVTRGQVKPGETITIQFKQSSESPLIRYRLTELDIDLKPRRVLLEQTGKVTFVSGEMVRWSAELPKDGDDTPYLISAEARDESGSVLDTALTYAVIPKQEVNARLTIAKVAYRFGETAELSLYNAGPTYLFYGSSYTIERREGKKWRDIPPPYAFALVGYTLLPGKMNTDKISLDFKGLEPGHYRFTKHFSGIGTDIETALGVEFDIVK